MFKKIILSTALSAIFVSSSLMATETSKDKTEMEKYVEYKFGQKLDTLAENQLQQVEREMKGRANLYKVAKEMNIISEDDEKVKFLQEITKKDIYINVFLDTYHKNIKIDDLEAKSTYEERLKAGIYNKEETYKARHILVNTEEEAKEIIESLKKSTIELNTNFIELAKTKSTGPSGVNGGDLGWFEAKMMVPEFSNALVELEKGKITETPVKTQFGYHVILLEDRKNPSIKKFEEVKEEIKKELKDQKMQKFVQEQIEGK